MNKFFRTAILLAAFGCASLPARAGVVIKRESGEPGGQEKQHSTLYIQGGKIRMEMDSERGKILMIFDGDKQVLWMIQPDHTYMEMTAETVQRMSQMQGQMQSQMAADPRMQEAMKQMQDKMANMSPEQRAMVEQAMKGRGGMTGGSAAASAPPTITYQAKGGSDKVGMFTCSKYDQLSNGTRNAELCVASVEQLHISESEMRAFREMGKFMEPMRRMNPRGGMSAPVSEQLHGFPVRTVLFQGEKPIHEETVLSVEQKSVDPALFALPEGLTKRDMMGGRGGPR